MIGLPNWSNGERVNRFGEYVELLGMLLTDDVTTYEGEYYQADNAVMNPSSLQRPRIPLVAAALGPRMMRHAAALFEELVDGLVAAGYTEIGLYYPSDESQIAAFEHIASEIVPRLRQRD